MRMVGVRRKRHSRRRDPPAVPSRRTGFWVIIVPQRHLQFSGRPNSAGIFLMKIAVIGTGYVGLVTGTCFADSGNDVTCVDIDQAKIDRLNRGEIPIYEPGLAELVRDNQAAERLHVHDRPGRRRHAGRDRLSGRRHAAKRRRRGRPVGAVGGGRRASRRTCGPTPIVVTKSTVPVGTCAKIFARLKELTGRDCDVASNPEFLKEGSAIEDFIKPDRVVVGVRRAEVGDVLHELVQAVPADREAVPRRCRPKARS